MSGVFFGMGSLIVKFANKREGEKVPAALLALYRYIGKECS